MTKLGREYWQEAHDTGKIEGIEEGRDEERRLIAEKLLRKAITDYASVGQIKMIPTQNGFRCVFSSTLVDSERMANEFDNYLIELLNSGEKHADL